MMIPLDSWLHSIRTLHLDDGFRMAWVPTVSGALGDHGGTRLVTHAG